MTFSKKISTVAALFISVVALNTHAAPSCGGHICTPQELDCMVNPAFCTQDPGQNHPPSSSFLQNGYSLNFSYVEAAQEATDKANAECAPRKAIRVTPFQFQRTTGKIAGVTASAYFKCDI